VMQHELDHRELVVHDFEKLGTLPLEAEIILVRKRRRPDLAALHPEFDFLLRHLGRYTVVEYKSPQDRLTHDDLDTVRAYALLCKRKFKLTYDRDVRVALLYSHIEERFFEISRKNGLLFQDTEPGIKRCDLGHLVLLAMDLAKLGQDRPGRLINLFSSRHREFVVNPQADQRMLDVIGHIYENIFKRDTMKHAELRGLPEFTQDMNEIRRRLLESYTAEERLEGLPTEKRLEGLSVEEILRHLSPEEIVRQMSSEDFLRRVPQAERDLLRKRLEHQLQ